jgi:hypothetical protein
MRPLPALLGAARRLRPTGGALALAALALQATLGDDRPAAGAGTALLDADGGRGHD